MINGSRASFPELDSGINSISTHSKTRESLRNVIRIEQMGVSGSRNQFDAVPISAKNVEDKNGRSDKNEREDKKQQPTTGTADTVIAKTRRRWDD